MCLNRKNWLPKFSIKPIQVYKILLQNPGTSKCLTPAMLEEVELGMTILAKKKWYGLILFPTTPIEGEAVHAITDPDSYLANYYLPQASLKYISLKYLIVEATIPPLTPYWIDKNMEEICSTKLIITDKIVRESHYNSSSKSYTFQDLKQ